MRTAPALRLRSPERQAAPALRPLPGGGRRHRRRGARFDALLRRLAPLAAEHGFAPPPDRPA